MSLSWKFPSWAESSCNGFEPSRVEQGHFNFWAETSWIFFSCFYQFLSQKISHFMKKKHKENQKIEKSSESAREIREKTILQFSSWREKVMSRAESKILQLELWLQPAWLELITSLYPNIFQLKLSILDHSAPNYVRRLFFWW